MVTPVTASAAVEMLTESVSWTAGRICPSMSQLLLLTGKHYAVGSTACSANVAAVNATAQVSTPLRPRLRQPREAAVEGQQRELGRPLRDEDEEEGIPRDVEQTAPHWPRDAVDGLVLRPAHVALPPAVLPRVNVDQGHPREPGKSTRASERSGVHLRGRGLFWRNHT